MSETERICGTCTNWDRYSISSTRGVCRAPGAHRYIHARMPNGTTAFLDSFGEEETREHDNCGAWRYGAPDGDIYIGPAHPTTEGAE